MATNFYMQRDGESEIDIESSFGIRITEVRGLNPPNPKELFTRDWADEDGIDYYIPTTRRVKPSDVTIAFYAEDDLVKTAIYKYEDFCYYLLNTDLPIVYRDTLQYRSAELIYATNKPAWYQLFVGPNKKLVAEVTFIAPTGVITNVEPV